LTTKKYGSLLTVSIDVDEVIGALKREDLSLLVGGTCTAIDAWSDWLVWLGQWMRVQSALDGRRIAIVRLPTRRLAAGFTCAGVVFAAAAIHDDSLDWDALRNLPPGTKIFWRELASGRATKRSGTVSGVRVIAGSELMEVAVETQRRSEPSTRVFAKSAALSYGITLGAISVQADERLAGAERLVGAALMDVAPGWIRSSAIECTLITERSSFLEDLGDLAVRARNGAEASLADLLVIKDAGDRAHGKTKVASARRDGVLDESGSVTILDGAAAALRMGDTVARSVVVLLDQAEYDDEVEQVVRTYAGYSVDAHIRPPASGVKAPPSSVEVFVFGLPAQSRGQA
jgi:hypothetical protein